LPPCNGGVGCGPITIEGGQQLFCRSFDNGPYQWVTQAAAGNLCNNSGQICQHTAACAGQTFQCEATCDGRANWSWISESSCTPNRCNYIGCFEDYTPQRALPVEAINNGSVSDEGCAKLCYQLGYSFAGTQFSSYCFCGGTTYSEYGAATHPCNMTCTANGAEICGGISANSVYATGR
jgi:hypothetical protein